MATTTTTIASLYTSLGNTPTFMVATRLEIASDALALASASYNAAGADLIAEPLCSLASAAEYRAYKVLIVARHHHHRAASAYRRWATA